MPGETDLPRSGPGQNSGSSKPPVVDRDDDPGRDKAYEREELERELDSDRDDFARSDEEGWFYE